MSVSVNASITTILVLVFMFVLFCLAGIIPAAMRPVADHCKRLLSCSQAAARFDWSSFNSLMLHSTWVNRNAGRLQVRYPLRLYFTDANGVEQWTRKRLVVHSYRLGSGRAVQRGYAGGDVDQASARGLRCAHCHGGHHGKAVDPAGNRGRGRAVALQARHNSGPAIPEKIIYAHRHETIPGWSSELDTVPPE